MPPPAFRKTATINGCSAISLITNQTVGNSGRRVPSVNAIQSGITENRKILSKQKISAVGTADCMPNTASANPGPM